MEHFAFPDNIDFAADDQRIHVLFMKGSCNCSSMKQSYTIGESRGISHLDNTEPRLLWRTPTKIRAEKTTTTRSRAQSKKEHRLAQRRQRRQHSDQKHVQTQRQNTTITLQNFRLQFLLQLLLQNHPK